MYGNALTAHSATVQGAEAFHLAGGRFVLPCPSPPSRGSGVAFSYPSETWGSVQDRTIRAIILCARNRGLKLVIIATVTNIP